MVALNGFTSILIMIPSKSGILKEEQHERISYGDKVENVKVPEVML